MRGNPYLVFKVLSGDEWVEKIQVRFSLHDANFSASPTDIGMTMECFPQLIDRATARFSPHIQQDTNVWRQDWTKSIKEPSVRVDLLGVLFFQAE
jgi:hypothetical protein